MEEDAGAVANVSVTAFVVVATTSHSTTAGLAPDTSYTRTRGIALPRLCVTVSVVEEPSPMAPEL